MRTGRRLALDDFDENIRCQIYSAQCYENADDNAQDFGRYLLAAREYGGAGKEHDDAGDQLDRVVDTHGASCMNN